MPDSVVAHTNIIPGLIVFNDFVTEAEEADLIAKIDEGDWKKMLKRRVQ